MYTNTFYNPYMNYGYTGRFGKPTMFSKMFKNFSLSKFLTGTGKTLNVINQAIPIYYQVKPIISNAKTMFKVMNAVRNNNDVTDVSNTIKQTNTTKHNTSDGSPTFFV